jgi:hypothetical protein
MNAAIWHHLVPFNETPTLLQGGGWISGSFAFAFAFGLRSQRVDGRRFDAFVADLPCSRVHRGAAPIVSYVSALPRPSACVCAEGEAVEPNGALRATSASTAGCTL